MAVTSDNLVPLLDQEERTGDTQILLWSIARMLSSHRGSSNCGCPRFIDLSTLPKNLESFGRNLSQEEELHRIRPLARLIEAQSCRLATLIRLHCSFPGLGNSRAYLQLSTSVLLMRHNGRDFGMAFQRLLQSDVGRINTIPNTDFEDGKTTSHTETADNKEDRNFVGRRGPETHF